MQSNKNLLASSANRPPGTPFFRARHWRSLAAILAVLVVAGFMLYQQRWKTASEPPHQNDLYMPVVDPVLEPDRPDLIGDSLSDEQAK